MNYPENFLETTSQLLNVDKTSKLDIMSYVIHYTPFKNRKDNMKEQCKQIGLKPIYVESFDRENLTNNENKMFSSNFLNQREVSVFMKHLTALKHAYKNGYERVLVMEDDCLFGDAFSRCLDLYQGQLPKNWDMLYVGDAFGFRISNDEITKQIDALGHHTNVFEKCKHPTNKQGGGCSKTADAIIYSRNCIEKILSELELPDYLVHHPYDWFLSYVARSYNMNVYWCEPSLVKHGSQSNYFNDI